MFQQVRDAMVDHPLTGQDHNQAQVMRYVFEEKKQVHFLDIYDRSVDFQSHYLLIFFHFTKGRKIMKFQNAKN